MKDTVLTFDTLIAYEAGELDEVGTLMYFAELIRTGTAWQLQGHYGRTAAALIENGLVTPEGEVTEAAFDLLDEAL